MSERGDKDYSWVAGPDLEPPRPAEDINLDVVSAFVNEIQYSTRLKMVIERALGLCHDQVFASDFKTYMIDILESAPERGE